MSALSPKQRRFVGEYMVDLNATQAAIRAGYSAKTAKAQSSQLLSKPQIAEAIAAEQSARSERTKITADWVLTRLMAEADADVADLYTAEGALKPVYEWPEIWRKGLVAGLDVEEIKAEGVTIGVIRKIKLSDRIKRIELIGKHVSVQAFSEKLDAKVTHSVDDSVSGLLTRIAQSGRRLVPQQDDDQEG